MIALTLLGRLRDSKWALIVIGILAILSSAYGLGKLRYAEGHRDGSAEAARAAAIDAATARAAFDSSWAVLYAQAAAARDAQRTAEAAAARARTRSAVAEAKLTDALTAYHADTVVQSATCDALATACANAAALWTHERDTLTALIAAQDSVVFRQAQIMENEPARLADAMRAALARQRETFRGPSRVRWLSVGAAMGAAVIHFF